MEQQSTGLHLTRSQDAFALADLAASRLHGAPADPFVEPLVLVPGNALRRWLTQRIAVTRSEGICAGIEFADPGALEWLLTGDDPASDPWAPKRLAWHILDAAASGTPGIESLVRHLDANPQRFANASRVAGLFRQYIEHRPGMLREWEVGDGPDLGFDSWQVHLWRHLKASIVAPDPIQRRATLVAALNAGDIGVPWPTVILFAPRRLTAGGLELLTAISSHVRVDALAIEPANGLAAELAPLLGRRGEADRRLLSEFAVSDRKLPSNRGTPQVQVHASHGLNRQVEVLRETLTGLFSDDPTLEPRDVAIASPDLPGVAPHLSASFPSPDEPGADRHPASQLRLQVSARSVAEANRLYPLLRQIADLAASRASSSELLGICSHPFVARRFGLDDDPERLTDLITAAAIRWGVSAAHREHFGLGQIRQGTWQVGVQRLLLGEALSGETPTHVAQIAPVDDVGSQDITLVGALAELVTRVWRIASECTSSAPATIWVGRFRSILETLVAVPFEEEWQLNQVWSALHRIELGSQDSGTDLSVTDALAMLDAELASSFTRPSYGNGSLVAAPLWQICQVPHRVMCLIGMPDGSFPRSRVGDGDDLMALDQLPTDPNPGADDRQDLLDVLIATSDKVIIVYQGYSSATNEVLHPPAGLIDIIESKQTQVLQQPLNAYSPRSFLEQPGSFDRASLRAANALLGPRTPSTDPFGFDRLPLPSRPETLDLVDLKGFLKHPAQYLLRKRAQLSFFDEGELATSLPTELDSLARWAIGNRILNGAIAGRDLDALIAQEWLLGDVPPGELGRRVLDDLGGQVSQILGGRQPFAVGEQAHNLIDVSVSGVRLTGLVATVSGRILNSGFSKVSPKYLADAWVDALALTVQLGRPVDAVIVGSGSGRQSGRRQLAGVEPGTATQLLTRLVNLSIEGMERVLPMPPKISHTWARSRIENRDPLTAGIVWDWRYEADQAWRLFFPDNADPWEQLVTDENWAQPNEPTVMGSLAALVWDPIVRAER